MVESQGDPLASWRTRSLIISCSMWMAWWPSEATVAQWPDPCGGYCLRITIIYIIIYICIHTVQIYIYICIYIQCICMYSADTVHSRYHSHLRKELSLRDMPWVIRIRWPPKTAYIAVFSFAAMASRAFYTVPSCQERGACRFLQNERHCRSSHPEDLRSRRWVNPWWLVSGSGRWPGGKKGFVCSFFLCC